METIELVGYVIVLLLALLIIVYGLMKLKGITLLQRGRHPDPPEDDDLWLSPDEIDDLENADDTPDFISQNHLSEQTPNIKEV